MLDEWYSQEFKGERPISQKKVHLRSGACLQEKELDSSLSWAAAFAFKP